MRKAISLLLVFLILLLSGNMIATERRGADLIIQRTHGTQVRGELIAVKQNSLLLLDRESGADVTVNNYDVGMMTIAKKSQVVNGFLIGEAIGAIIGAVTYPKPESEGIVPDFDGLQAIGIAYGIGILGGLIGLVLGAAAGTDKTIQFEGKSDSEIQEILKKLCKKARVKNAQ